MTKRFESGPRMSQAVVHDGTVHIAGQVADNRKSSLEQQTREILDKIESLLAKTGSDKSKLLSVTVLLPNISDFDAFNTVYDAWIDPANPPVRACFEARLADPDLRVELTAIACV